MSASSFLTNSTTALLRTLSLIQAPGDVIGAEGEEGGREGPRENLNSEGHVQWEALPTPNSFPLPLLSPCPASPPFEQVLRVSGERPRVEGGKAKEEGGESKGMIGGEEREGPDGGFNR
jgi:hypothetical protein